MLKSRFTLALMCALMLGITFGAGNMALATSIDPGFDLFRTVTPGTVVNLGVLGLVELEGLPIGPGNTDTIVERLGGIDPFNVTDLNVLIDIQLVELSLQSVDPVDIGGTDFDLVVTELPSAIGQMFVSHEVADGGTFDASLPVEALLTFTEVGNPLVFFTDVFSLVFESSNVHWSHTPSPSDTHNATFPAGDFYAGVWPGTGGMPEIFDEVFLLNKHRVTPSTPEPSSLLLFAVGLLGALGYGWRKRKQA